MTKAATTSKVSGSSRKASATRRLLLPKTGQFITDPSVDLDKVNRRIRKELETNLAASQAVKKAYSTIESPRDYASWEELLKNLIVDRKFAITSEQAVKMLDKGLPAKLVPDLIQTLGVAATELSYLIGLDRSTVTRLKQNDKPLPMHSAESILRLVEVKQLAAEVFGSTDTADKWLNKPHPMFGSKPPLAETRSSYGAQHVKDVLLAIKYGGVV